MKKLLFLLTAITLLIISCRKDNTTTNIDFVPEGEETIETELIGQVINADGEPIADATISLSGITLATNEDGIFRIETIALGTNGSLVTIEKDGFHTNFKRVIPTEEETFIKLGLTPKVAPTGSFQASEGGVISRQGKEKIIFEANSIVDASGKEYTGAVSVFSDFFNKDKPYLEEIMPGDLSGLNQQGTAVQLETYSMVLVELFGEDGEELNLKEGTTAKIEFPVSLQTPNPPSEIALWSLNENTGLWIEEGTASYDGTAYQAEVSHFSYWNCDDPFPVLTLRGQFFDLNGIPMAYRKVNISFPKRGTMGSGYTNGNGVFSGLVPANEVLELSIYNTCEVLIYEERVGPFSENTKLQTVFADVLENTTNVTGRIVDCNGQPVSEGFVTISDELGRSNFFVAESDGSFNVDYVNCGATTLRVKGSDAIEFTESDEVKLFDKGQATLNAGTLRTCTEITETLNINLRGDENIVPDIEVTISSFVSSVRIKNYLNTGVVPTDRSTFYLYLKTLNTGEIFPTQLIYKDIDAPASLGCHSPVDDQPCEPHFSINITRADNYIGGYWQGIGVGRLYNDVRLLPTPAYVAFKAPVTAITKRINGKLWLDSNKNGLQDAGEPPFTDAVVGIDYENPSGGRATTRVSIDENGAYDLALVLSDSIVNFSILDLNMTDYALTQNDVGNDALDSDFNATTGLIQNVIVHGEPEALIFDCGIIER